MGYYFVGSRHICPECGGPIFWTGSPAPAG
jgi:hypothetical protein